MEEALLSLMRALDKAARAARRAQRQRLPSMLTLLLKKHGYNVTRRGRGRKQYIIAERDDQSIYVLPPQGEVVAVVVKRKRIMVRVGLEELEQVLAR